DWLPVWKHGWVGSHYLRRLACGVVHHVREKRHHYPGRRSRPPRIAAALWNHSSVQRGGSRRELVANPTDCAVHGGLQDQIEVPGSQASASAPCTHLAGT